MQYTCEIVINQPREKVIDLFEDLAYIKEWQPTFVRVEPISGELGATGSTSNMVYKRGKGEMTMLETIVNNNLPDTFVATYDVPSPKVHNIVENRFEEVGANQTRWIIDCEFQFGLMMSVMSVFMRGTFRKETENTMKNFKAFAEKQP